MNFALNNLKQLVKHRSHKTLFGAGLVWLILFAILISVAHRLPGTDDYIFQQQIKPYPNLLGWLDFRYHAWSGRLFSESFMYIFSPLPLYYWKIVSICMYGIYCIYSYLTYKLFVKKYSPVQAILALSFACAVPYLMNVYAYYDATLWVTGGMAYFWMFVIGFMGIYPILYTFTKSRTPKWYYSLIGAFATVIACSSHEQLGAFIATSTLIAIFILIYKYTRKKIDKSILLYIIAFFFIAITSLAISILAPGNQVRANAEITTWIPDFQSISTIMRAHYSIRWFLDAVINHTGFLLPLIWAGLAANIGFLHNRKKIHDIAIFFLCIASLTTILRGYAPFEYIFNFHAQWGIQNFSARSMCIALLWLTLLLVTLWATLLVQKPLRWYCFILFGGAIACTAVVTLSPTMYASGWRTLYVPSMLLSALVVALYYPVAAKYTVNKYSLLPVIFIAFLALAQYFYLLFRILY